MPKNNLYKDQIRDLLSEALKAAFPAVRAEPHIEYPASSDHGDYASNIALQLTKELGQAPREIATKIIEHLPENQLIGSVELAGPGFINIFLSEEKLRIELQRVLDEKEQYGDLDHGQGRTVIVEFSSPNIAKPLAAHHLLTTVIGQSIDFIYQKVGYKTVAINHIGDWGTQFGKLIVAYKQWGDREVVESNPIPELLKLYVKFHDEAETNPALEDQGRAEFKKFEDGDEENRQLWQWFVDVSMKDIGRTYERLGHIHFDQVMGESFYEDKMEEIVELGLEKGVFEEGREGALVINFEDENMPTAVVKKKDGATLYITRDLATIKYRVDHWKPEKILYVVDVAQSLHFKQLFDTAKRLDLCEDEPVHVVFGRMRMKDGKASTRKGNVIFMNDVIDDAENRAKALLEEKNSELKNKDQVAHAVAIGAIKYNILSQNRLTDITFDWDKMLSFDGNSAPYLQYTYARAKSILRRAEEDSGEGFADPENAESLTNAVLRSLPKFSEQLLLAAEDYRPNVLTNYIFDFAQKFNAFYNSVPVLKAQDSALREERLKIVEAAAQLIENVLELLGIDVVEEM